MSNIPTDHRSCDHSPKDQQVDVIVENNPAELQGACREVLQALTLRAALVSSVDPSQCVEAPQSYSLLTQAPYNFTFRTGSNCLLDACRIWVFKSMMGQTDADTGDIDIKDLLLYPRQERKTCVLSTGATCVVTISVSTPRTSASMTRVPPRLENAVPWGLRTAADTLDTFIHENAEPYPAPLEGKPTVTHQVAPMSHHAGIGIYLQTSGRGHTRSLSPVPRTLWTSATSRLVAPPLTSLPTPMAATRSSTLTYQASPVSRRSPLAPEHPRVATYTSSGLTYSVVDSTAAPAIRVTPINQQAEMVSAHPPSSQTGVNPTPAVSVNVSSARQVKLSVSSTGSQASPVVAESTSAPVTDTAVSVTSSTIETGVSETNENINLQVTVTSPPKPEKLAEGSTEVLSPGEVNEVESRSTEEVVDLEQGSAGRREKATSTSTASVQTVGTQGQVVPMEKCIVTSTDKVEMYQLKPRVVGVETITTTTTETLMSRVESTTNEEENSAGEEQVLSPKEKAVMKIDIQKTQSDLKLSESMKEGTAPMSPEIKEKYMSELQRDIKEAIEKETEVAIEQSEGKEEVVATDEDHSGDADLSSEGQTKIYEIVEFWSQERLGNVGYLESSTLAADTSIAIVSSDTKIIRCDYKSFTFSVVEASVKEAFAEPFSWIIQHKGSQDAVIPGFIKAPWDVCMNLVPFSVVRISVDMGDRGTYASGIIDVPKMIISTASALYGTLELYKPDGSKAAEFLMTVQFRLLREVIGSSPIVNLGKALSPPRYNTCVFNCLGVEDNSSASTVNTYKIGVGMNDNINTYMLVDNTSDSSQQHKANAGICLSLEDLEDEKIVTIDVHKIQSSRGKAQERIFLGHAKFDLNDLIKERLTRFDGLLEIYDGNVKLHGTQLKVEIALEDEVEEEEVETLTEVHVKSTIMKQMTLTSQRTSPQLDQNYHNLRSVIEEIPAAKAKKKMIDVLKEVPVARHKKIMTKVVKEVPVAHTKKKMAPVLEDIAKRPYRKCMSNVVEEFHHHRLKKAMQPVIQEVPQVPIKKTIRKLCSEIPAAVEQRQQLRKSLSTGSSSARILEGQDLPRDSKESLVEITEEPCIFSVTSVTQSPVAVPLTHRTTDSEATSSTLQGTVRSKKTKSTNTTSRTTVTSKSSIAVDATSSANDIASKITKAISEDPACATLDPTAVIKLLEIFRKTMVPQSTQQFATIKEAATPTTAKEGTTRLRGVASKTSSKSTSASVRSKSQAK